MFNLAPQGLSLSKLPVLSMRLYLSSYRLGTATDRLIDLVGENRRAVVICNATDHRDAAEQEQRLAWECDALRSIGLEPEGLDLREHFGWPNALRDALKEVGLVWVRGGNTFTLRRAMVASGFDPLIKELLEDDALVYGGFSAGAVAATPTLRGIHLIDKPEQIPPGYSERIEWDALGLVDFSIAPHFRSPHPESPGVEATVAYFEQHAMPYRALRDGEAIVVDGGTTMIVGRPYTDEQSEDPRSAISPDEGP